MPRGIMFINGEGDWECRHCHTSALMYESVGHYPDCPVIEESRCTPAAPDVDEMVAQGELHCYE